VLDDRAGGPQELLGVQVVLVDRNKGKNRRGCEFSFHACSNQTDLIRRGTIRQIKGGGEGRNGGRKEMERRTHDVPILALPPWPPRRSNQHKQNQTKRTLDHHTRREGGREGGRESGTYLF